VNAEAKNIYSIKIASVKQTGIGLMVSATNQNNICNLGYTVKACHHEEYTRLPAYSYNNYRLLQKK